MTLSHADYRLACRAHAATVAVAATTTTFTRASTATYTDVNGIVQTAAVDEYRDAHYVNAVLTPLYEAAGTNLLVRSEDLSHAAWTGTTTFSALGVVADASVAPDGATAADTAQRVGQLFTPSGTGAHRFSVYVKANGTTTGSTTSDVLFYRGAVAATGPWTTMLDVRLTWSGGVPTAAINSGNGTLLATEAFANGWYRVGGYATVGTDNFYVASLQSASGTVDWWGADVRAGSTMDSYIPSGATAGTRAADIGIAFAATATGYTRDAGSFVTEGFRAGMEVVPTGFTDTTARTIKGVTALTLTVNGSPTVQASAVGRSLAVGLPATRVWENTEPNPRVAAPAPYVGERYFPGTLAQVTSGPLGWLEATAIYQLDLYVAADYSHASLDRYADALTVHFAPRQTLTTGDGTVIRVGILGAFPTRSSIAKAEHAGFAVLSVSFPLVIRIPNTI